MITLENLATVMDHFAVDTIPTYPARPINGGPLEHALPKNGKWFYEGKFNDWRSLVHIPAGHMWNRQGERLTIENEFRIALGTLRSTLAAGAFKWADCATLGRRHKVGKGSLIVLDVVPEPAFRSAGYEERRSWLETVLPTLGARCVPNADSLYLPANTLETDFGDLAGAWTALQEWNKVVGCDFYEGFVAKRAGSPYPMQLQSPDKAFAFWVKHRWTF